MKRGCAFCEDSTAWGVACSTCTKVLLEGGVLGAVIVEVVRWLLTK